MATDPVATYLEEVRQDATLLAKTKAPSWATVPRITRMIGHAERLAKAVEAALARHQPKPSVRLVPCGAHERWAGALCGVPDFGQEFETENLRVRRACPACEVHDEPYCGCCVDEEGRWQDWPCQEYQDITRALLGEES